MAGHGRMFQGSPRNMRHTSRPLTILLFLMLATIKLQDLAGGSNNWRESILALDIDTGAIKWGSRLGGPDAWNAGILHLYPEGATARITRWSVLSPCNS
jgi:hypothetical protein